MDKIKQTRQLLDAFNDYSKSQINESTEIVSEKKGPCWKGYEMIGMKKKGKKEVPNCVPIEEDSDKNSKNYMFFQNIKQINQLTSEILKLDQNKLDELMNEHSWAIDHIATSKDDIEEVANFIKSVMSGDYDEETLTEAKYQGRDVELNKPMQGDVKKFKVYVKYPSTGNIKKVNFGAKGMKIKKSNPKRRKSFRARHKCSTAKDKTTARYWSCKKW